jgi:hypothetical protein
MGPRQVRDEAASRRLKPVSLIEWRPNGPSSDAHAGADLASTSRYLVGVTLGEA